MSAPDANGWMPIETAPKDGTWVEAWRGSANCGVWSNPVYVRWCQFDEDDAAWVWPDDTYDVTFARGIDQADEQILNGDCYEDAKNFSHWRPLPEPPITNSSELSPSQDLAKPNAEPLPALGTPSIQEPQ